jgi:hypothetical protein
MPTDVLTVNIAVLFAVLEADLGRRKVTSFCILRPLLLAAAIIPLFIVHPAIAGNGEILEIALAGLGALLGVVAAGGLMKVNFDDATQRCVSTAGSAYGAFWPRSSGPRSFSPTAPRSHSAWSGAIHFQTWPSFVRTEVRRRRLGWVKYHSFEWDSWWWRLGIRSDWPAPSRRAWSVPWAARCQPGPGTTCGSSMT